LASLLQDVGQVRLVPLHTNDPHDEGVPAATAAQVPLAHDAHACVHAVLQQTPATQRPLEH
jgi:hypothetical protein